MTSDNQEIGASVQECVRLFLVNQTPNSTETIMRVRALQELSEGVGTEDLMALAAAIRHANGARQLTDALTDFLRTPRGVVAA